VESTIHLSVTRLPERAASTFGIKVPVFVATADRAPFEPFYRGDVSPGDAERGSGTVCRSCTILTDAWRPGRVRDVTRCHFHSELHMPPRSSTARPRRRWPWPSVRCAHWGSAGGTRSAGDAGAPPLGSGAPEPDAAGAPPAPAAAPAANGTAQRMRPAGRPGRSALPSLSRTIAKDVRADVAGEVTRRAPGFVSRSARLAHDRAGAALALAQEHAGRSGTRGQAWERSRKTPARADSLAAIGRPPPPPPAVAASHRRGAAAGGRTERQRARWDTRAHPGS